MMAYEEEAGDRFPEGLRVLVVDDDLSHLRVLEGLLRSCFYDVTSCGGAHDALCLLRDQKKGSFDILLANFHMADMDGFEFLETVVVSTEMESQTSLPVVMFSCHQDRDVIVKGLVRGACAFLVKPISMEAIQMLWQHAVVCKRRKNYLENHNPTKPAADDKGKKRPRQQQMMSSDRESGSSSGKRRLVWTQYLQQKFLEAINLIDAKNVVPKRIQECLEQMGVSGLTRHQISSHLQKVRLEMRKKQQQPPQSSSMQQVGCSTFVPVLTDNSSYNLGSSLPTTTAVVGCRNYHDIVSDGGSYNSTRTPASTGLGPAVAVGALTNMEFSFEPNRMLMSGLSKLSIGATDQYSMRNTPINSTASSGTTNFAAFQNQFHHSPMSHDDGLFIKSTASSSTLHQSTTASYPAIDIRYHQQQNHQPLRNPENDTTVGYDLQNLFDVPTGQDNNYGMIFGADQAAALW